VLLSESDLVTRINTTLPTTLQPKTQVHQAPMNLSNQFTNLPAPLQTEVTRYWQSFLDHATPAMVEMLAANITVFNSLPRVWAGSPFVAKHCVHYPGLLADLVQSGDLLQNSTNYLQQLNKLLNPNIEEIELHKILRDYRRREMVRIAWRDLAGWADLNESLRCLSELADALIEAALNQLYQKLTTMWGKPIGISGKIQPLVVLGMGKLGGQELNFSSDIDLIFVYPEAGETQGVARTRSNQEFFLRLGQQLINALNNNSADGFVYRVDMRLRPFGESGALAMNFNAFEDYYQAHARDWERYAMIKARVVAGDLLEGQKLLTSLKPFVYRRYLDYNAFESLRDMKNLIDQETRRKGLKDNIKLGAGGIREVEFVCQVFQLIRGGRQPALQQRNLLATLAQLENLQYFSAEEAAGLRAAYIFLRICENRLQAIDDMQTQTLPVDDLQQLRLAFSMEFATWNDFYHALQQHLIVVQQEFKRVIAPASDDTTTESTIQLTAQKTLWANVLLNNTEAVENWLKTAEFTDGVEIAKHLQQFVLSPSVHKMSARGRERLDSIIPLLFNILQSSPHKDIASHRIIDFIESIVQRSVYLALLIERPQVLTQLVKLCAASSWLAEQLTRYPLLLDELLDPRRLYDPCKPEDLDSVLQAQLAHLPLDDLEMLMDSLRQFKRAHVLHVAAAEISGNLKVERTSDYLTAIADTLVGRTLAIAREHLSQKHGVPMCHVAGEMQTAGFCVVAYGKAGSIELTYSSDLDLVFLHNSHGDNQSTEGAKSLDNNVFFARLAQRMIHILTTNTSGGILYEVDQRLRPSGASGLLVSGLDAFRSYQLQDAWTWEHQALVRARVIAGDHACQAKFQQIRREVLSLSRDNQKLQQDVIEMRGKMRDSLDKSSATHFDIKQGNGGLADVEFIMQYMVLRWARQYPELLNSTAVLPTLRRLLEANLIVETAYQQLSYAYHCYRVEIHRLVLQNQPTRVPQDQLLDCRNSVCDWWQQLLEN